MTDNENLTFAELGDQSAATPPAAERARVGDEREGGLRGVQDLAAAYDIPV